MALTTGQPQETASNLALLSTLNSCCTLVHILHAHVCMRARARTHTHTHTHTHTLEPGILPILTMGFGIAEELSARKCGHLLVTGHYPMIPGLVVWYQPICSLDHAERFILCNLLLNNNFCGRETFIRSSLVQSLTHNSVHKQIEQDWRQHTPS